MYVVNYIIVNMVFFKKHLEVHCKKRDRKATEHALLMAASRLFAEKGYENTRTLEIAKEAGANEALIGRYFGGKEGLLSAVLQNADALRNVIDCDQESLKLDHFPTQDESKDLFDAMIIFFKNGRKSVELKEQVMRIGCSRSLVDPEIAKLIKTELCDQRIPRVIKSLETFSEIKALKKPERESLAILIMSSNFNLNFLGRKVHGLGDSQIDLALELLAKSISRSLT